jgi:predicted nucleotidyltransferase
MEMDQAMIGKIGAALREIEHEKRVTILYACEAGSRAWGIESADSDYDVRFLYMRKPHEYLRIELHRDVIEQPITDELDVSGWDIFKALRLLRKSNPPLLEWLLSPVVYLEAREIEVLRAIARAQYSSRAVFFHYRNMAYRNYQEYIAGRDPVPLKKYLYVVRPIVALLYLEQHHTLPPTSLLRTLEETELPHAILGSMRDLVERKRAGDELGMGAPERLLNAWIELHLEKWKEPMGETREGMFPVDLLDMWVYNVLFYHNSSISPEGMV